jgi:hypothetical protein
MRKTCRKECIELHDCWYACSLTFQKLKDWLSPVLRFNIVVKLSIRPFHP